jgi:4-hydroxy-tetrahydrodipicolinate synthase
MLYDVPGRTGTQIALETYEQAIRWEQVVAVKDAVNDFIRGVRLTELGYAVYSGDDASNLGWLAHGAVGFVSVVGHAAGNETRAMADAYWSGDPARALQIFTRLLPAIDAIMGVPNYGATTAKAALQLLGVLDNRNVRGPLVPLDDDEVAALRAGLAASGLL